MRIGCNFTRVGTVTLIVVALSVGSAFAQTPTVVPLAETSATYPAGYTSNGDLPPTQTSDPLGPFSGLSVDFVGTLQPGASTEVLGYVDGLPLGLVYRYQITYPASVTITSITLEGRAFNGPGNILRLLDADRNVIVSTPTTNSAAELQSTTLATPGAVGTVFFLDEFDTSQNVRYRSNVSINAVSTPQLFVASAANHQILRYDGATGAFVDAFVPAGSGGLSFPATAIFGPDGNLYVPSYVLGESGSVRRYSGATGAFLDAFVPSGSGGLTVPQYITFGPDGNLYVAELNGYVLRYHGVTGTFLGVFTSGVTPCGSCPGGTSAPLPPMYNPFGITFGPDGNLYVADRWQVLRFSGSTGALMDIFVPHSIGPQALVFGPDGNLYVGDSDGSGVFRYSGSTGALIDNFVPAGSGGLSVPQGLVFGPNGNFFVSDAGQNAILEYDGATGAFVRVFVLPGSGGLSVPEGFVFGPPPSSPPPTPNTILTSTKDSFLREGNGDRNEGSNPTIRVQATGRNRAVVEFNLTGINLAAVTSATLILTIAENINNWGPSGRTVDAHRLMSDFAEGNGQHANVPSSQSTRGNGAGVTWNCATDTEINNQQTNCAATWNGGDFATPTALAVLHVNSLSGKVEWDVTADVHAGGSRWLIKKTNEGATGEVAYYSREGSLQATGSLSLAPTLILRYN